jgi:hypothetical protein
MAFLWCETCAVERAFAGHVKPERGTPCCSACHKPTFKVPDLLRLKLRAEASAYHEAGVYGRGKPTDIHPDWVYEAREAIRHQNDNVPWLPDLLRILGWQGGTVHQALNAVARLVAADEDRRKADRPRCASCGWPSKEDGCCSRPGCCDSE